MRVPLLDTSMPGQPDLIARSLDAGRPSRMMRIAVGDSCSGTYLLEIFHLPVCSQARSGQGNRHSNFSYGQRSLDTSLT